MNAKKSVLISLSCFDEKKEFKKYRPIGYNRKFSAKKKTAKNFGKKTAI
jgi:hypothetical protein